MQKVICLIIFSVISISIYSFPSFQIRTEDWKPFQYFENGKIKGISVDIMDRMLEIVGSNQSKKDIEMLPWSRAYISTQNDDNGILFIGTRTEEREDLFKWVGPLLTYSNHLYAKKGSGVAINNLDELINYKIGSVKEDASEIFLQKLGVPLSEMFRANKGYDVLKALDRGRIDILLSERSSFLSDAESLHLDPNQFKQIYLASTSQLYYMFNKNISDDYIDAFQDAFNQLLESGEIDSIFKKYDFDVSKVQ